MEDLVDFIVSEEIEELAKQIYDRYLVYFAEFDFLEVAWIVKLDEPPKKATFYEFEGIKNDFFRLKLAENGVIYKYVFSTYEDVWNEISQSKKEWIIFKTLFSIDASGKGRLRKPDVSDYGIILEGAGIFWMLEDDLPSLLGGNDPYPIPMPRDDTDEGNSF